MSATIFSIDAKVVAAFKLSRALARECQDRLGRDPATAMRWAAASTRKRQEALELSRQNGEKRRLETPSPFPPPGNDANLRLVAPPPLKMTP